jgi:hypothetical protein
MAASATEAAAAAATGEPSHATASEAVAAAWEPSHDAASEARVHMRNGLHLPTWRRREAPCRSSSR